MYRSLWLSVLYLDSVFQLLDSSAHRIFVRQIHQNNAVLCSEQLEQFAETFDAHHVDILRKIDYVRFKRDKK